MSDNTFQSKEFKDNLKKYEAARKAGSDVFLDADDLTDIADYYYLHGQADEAIKTISFAIERFPGAVVPLSFRARLAILMDNDTKTARHYADLITDKNDLEYYYLMAEILIAEGKADDANLYLEQRETIVDEEELEDFFLDVATLFADYNLFDKAKLWLDKSDEKDDEDYLELKGRIALSRGDYEESERIFNRLLDRDPYHTSYWNLLASAQYLRHDISASIESSDFSLAIDTNDGDAIINKANALYLLGNFDEAMKYYTRYTQLQPRSEAGYMGIASIMMSRDRFQESLRQWDKAEQLCPDTSPNKTDILRNKALTYGYIGRFDKAGETIDKLEQLPEGVNSSTISLRGYLKLMEGDMGTASDLFQKAVAKSSPKDRNNTRFFIGYSYYDCGILREAHHIFRQLTTTSEDTSEFTDIWAYLAYTDYKLRLQDEFLSDLQQAVKLNPAGAQRELRGFFPQGMAITDYYTYALSHPILGIGFGRH